MIWLITIPFIVYFTFSNMYASGFPALYSEQGRNFLEWCFFLLVSTIISVLISLVPIGIACAIGSSFGRKSVIDQQYPLVALRQQDGVHGQFYFLGSGMIEDRQYYFWYRKEGKHISGGKTFREPDVRIFEDNANPRMVTFKGIIASDWARQYGWWVGFYNDETYGYCPDFYIPTGSIKEGFAL